MGSRPMQIKSHPSWPASFLPAAIKRSKEESSVTICFFAPVLIAAAPPRSRRRRPRERDGQVRGKEGEGDVRGLKRTKKKKGCM